MLFYHPEPIWKTETKAQDLRILPTLFHLDQAIMPIN